MTASVPDALHVFSNSPKLVSPLFGTSLNKGRLTSVALRDPPCVKPELPAGRIARDLEELLALVAVVLPCRFEAILLWPKHDWLLISFSERHIHNGATRSLNQTNLKGSQPCKPLRKSASTSLSLSSLQTKSCV